MERIGTFIFALMPLGIGLSAIGLLRGWLTIRKKTGERVAITGAFRVNLWFVAILSTTAGLLCLAAALGIFPVKPPGAN